MSKLRHSNLHSDVRYKNKRLPGARYIAISPNSAVDIEPTEPGTKLGDCVSIEDWSQDPRCVFNRQNIYNVLITHHLLFLVFDYDHDHSRSRRQSWLQTGTDNTNAIMRSPCAM